MEASEQEINVNKEMNQKLENKRKKYNRRKNWKRLGNLKLDKLNNNKNRKTNNFKLIKSNFKLSSSWRFLTDQNENNKKLQQGVFQKKNPTKKKERQKK